MHLIMATDSVFPMDVEDEFISCERDYCGPEPDQTRQIIESDSSNDEMEESADLEHAQLSAESADFASQDPVEKAAQEENEKVDIYKSCGCQLRHKHTPCSGLFTKEKLLDQCLVRLCLKICQFYMVI